MDVSQEQFEEFEFIIHLYLDFCQKEKVICLFCSIKTKKNLNLTLIQV